MNRHLLIEKIPHMKYKLAVISAFVLPFVFTICTAQEAGINFERKLSFAEIKDKAAKEDKMIFVDVYTTWCGPCKYMAQEIFTQKKVGDFFNKNFVNVAVQTDTSKKDNENIKKWYKDAKMIAEYYDVSSYPTFLFLNAKGELIHTIKGASRDADTFLGQSQKALDTATQYAHLKNKFNEGSRDPDFLRLLLQAAKEAGDVSSRYMYANTYLSTQKDLISPQHISLIAETTQSSQDVGFNILIDHPEEVNAVIGNGQRVWILNRIAFDEQIFPTIMPEGKKTSYGGGLNIYGGGKMEKNVNWALLKEKLAPTYGSLTEWIALNGQLRYYSWNGSEEWDTFNNLLIEYTSGRKEIDTSLIYRNALTLLKDCEDLSSLKKAQQWTMVLVREPCVPAYTQAYSTLLYQSGEKEVAIQHLERCTLSLPSSHQSLNDLLAEMKGGKELDLDD